MLELPNDIDSLQALIKGLLEKIKQLEAENAELCLRLGLDSHNSDKPPSSDGYQKKRIKLGIPNNGKRSNGGQEGHKGKTLERVAKPDQVQIHLPEQCQCCGRQFTREDVHEIIQSRQVFDLPEPKLEIIEHRIGEITCWGQLQRGQCPKEVTASVQYGAGVRAQVTKLSIDHQMPFEQISQLFEDRYGYELNTATIEEALKRGYTLAEPIENQIIAHLRTQQPFILMKRVYASLVNYTGFY